MSLYVADKTYNSGVFSGAERVIGLNPGVFRRKMNTGSAIHDIASWSSSGTERTITTSTAHGAEVGDVICVSDTTSTVAKPSVLGYGVVTHVDSEYIIRFQGYFSSSDSASSNGETILVQKWRTIRVGFRWAAIAPNTSSWAPTNEIMICLSAGNYAWPNTLAVPQAVGADWGAFGYSTFNYLSDGSGTRYHTTLGSGNTATFRYTRGGSSGSYTTGSATNQGVMPAARDCAGAVFLEVSIEAATNRPIYRLAWVKYDQQQVLTSSVFRDTYLKDINNWGTTPPSTIYSMAYTAAGLAWVAQPAYGLMEWMELSWEDPTIPIEILDYGWNIVARQ